MIEWGGGGRFRTFYFSVVAPIPVLGRRAADIDLDIVLVVRERPHYAPVQHFRRDIALQAQLLVGGLATRRATLPTSLIGSRPSRAKANS